MFDNNGLNRSVFNGRLADRQGGSIGNGQNRFYFNVCSGFGAQSLNLKNIILMNQILLAAGLDYRISVHN